MLTMLGNTALVVGGFFVVFFGVSRVSNQGDHSLMSLPSVHDFADIAHADVPYSQSAYYGESAYYGQAGYGDSGDSGGSGGDSGSK